MRINTNIAALNAQRQLGQTEEAVSRSMAKLSSGFRITRAADDAAGLAIANKFRADMKSMDVASRNVSEATSLVQIAEGGASSIGDILTRMKELATQAASATSTTQKSALDGEYQKMGARSFVSQAPPSTRERSAQRGRDAHHPDRFGGNHGGHGHAGHRHDGPVRPHDR